MYINKKYLLYPFTDKSFAITKAMLEVGIDINVIASIGSGYLGKPIGHSVNRATPRKEVNSIYNIDFKIYDGVIIPENFRYNDQHEENKLLLNNINQHKLKVYFCGDVNPFKGYLDDTHIRYINTNIPIKNYTENSMKNYNRPIFKSKVPVVYIGQLLETQDSFDIGLQLKTELEKRNFTCSFISENSDGMILGALPYPQDFMGDGSSAEDQIVSFNLWIEAIDYCNKPDLLILDVPKGIMQYSSYIHNSFGIYAQMMATTIEPDFLILTITKDNIEEMLLDTINSRLREKLGRPVDVFHLSNSVFNIQPNNGTVLDKPLYIQEEKINNILSTISEKYESRLKYLSDNHEISVIADSIVNKFS